jgi:hypothetical protein
MAAIAPDCTPLPPWTSLFGSRLIDLLGWRLIDARPDEGWIRAGFNGKEEFCAAGGFVQGGILSAIVPVGNPIRLAREAESRNASVS